MAISGLGTSGIVAIPIPAGGGTGEVLTKQSNDDYDFDWAAGGGGGAPTNAEYVVLTADATLTDERVLTAGTGITIVDSGPGAAVTISFDGSTAGYTLQDAYDADTTAPHITPLLGTGLEIAGELQIDGSLTQGNNVSIEMSDTYTQAAAFIGGGILSNGTVTYANATWIWALLQESKGYIANSGPGFAAFTLFNAIPFIRNGTNNALVQALVLNAGVAHQSTGANAVTTVGTTVVSASPNTRALTAGGSMTKTGGDTGVRFSPTFGTVPGSSIAFGTLRGVHCFNPAVALFQPSGGIETMTAYYGVDINSITFGGGLNVVSGIRSAITAGTNRRFLENTGGAQSDFGTGTINFDDVAGVQLGTSNDILIAWGAGGFMFWQWAATADQLRWTNVATNRYILETENGNADGELNIGMERFSFGQTGAVGNQVGNFVANARTIGVAGEWADFLLTQAGSLTVDGNAMSRVSAWVINGVSYASSSGTVTNADTLTVGGFPTSSPGVTITERQSLHVIGGRSRMQSTVQYDPIVPAALAAGDTDNWGGLLTGTANNGMRRWARITGNASGSRITGIDAGSAQDGDTFDLTNVGSEAIILVHEDTGSTAANRFLVQNSVNFILLPDATCVIRYDSTDSRWRTLTPPAAVATLSGVWEFDSSTNTAADPGAGNFRNNNGTLASVTEIAINDEDERGADLGLYLAALASGDRIIISNLEDSDEYLAFDVTSNTDNTGWHQIGGTVNESGNNFTSGKEFGITFIYS